MEPFNIGAFPLIIIWWHAVRPSEGQYQDMVCESLGGSRHGRKMTQPGPECDMTDRNWCTAKTASYPEEMILEVILDNRGIMKRLFGDQREARFLRHEFDNNIYDAPRRPPPPRLGGRKKKAKKARTPKGVVPREEAPQGELVNGRFPASGILANARHGKKIDTGNAKDMKVITLEVYKDHYKGTKIRDALKEEDTEGREDFKEGGTKVGSGFKESNEGKLVPEKRNKVRNALKRGAGRRGALDRVRGVNTTVTPLTLTTTTSTTTTTTAATTTTTTTTTATPTTSTTSTSTTTTTAPTPTPTPTASTRSNDQAFSASTFDSASVRTTKPTNNSSTTQTYDDKDDDNDDNNDVSNDDDNNVDDNYDTDTDDPSSSIMPTVVTDEEQQQTSTIDAESVFEESSTMTETSVLSPDEPEATTPMPEISANSIRALDDNRNKEDLSTTSQANSTKLSHQEPSVRPSIPPLDSDDELTYASPSNTSQTAPPPSTVPERNSLRSDLAGVISEPEEKPDYLKGRVEFPKTRYTPSPNRVKNQPLNQVRKPPSFYQQAPPQNQRRRRPPPTQRPRPKVPSAPLRERADFPIPPSSQAFKTPPEKPSPTIPPFPMEKFPACNSTSELIAPTWAKNIQGKNLIVVNVGSFMQHLHVEECQKDALYRKMFCQRGCRCEQQYRLQKLLVIDPDDECRGIFSDWFRFPSCCVCVCYPASFRGTSSRHGRIIDEVNEEEDYYNDEEEDDYYDDDLDDPFVRHYYGLDKEEEEGEGEREDDYGIEEEEEDEEIEDYEGQGDEDDEKWEEEMAASASNHQPTYTSFTDIDSIDRSFTAGFPPRETGTNFPPADQQNESRLEKWVAHSNSFGGARQTPPLSPGYETNFRNMSAVDGEKKSRLLKGFGRTVNVRPQVAPRRTLPPSRQGPAPSYAFPWLKSPSLSIWPSLVYRQQFPSHNNYNSLTARKMMRDFAGFQRNQITTTVPPLRFEPTLGTLDAATPPFFNWRLKSRLMEKGTGSKGREDKTFILSRIPRAAGQVPRN